MDRKYDKIIIGAGLYGLYAAKRCSDKGEKVLVLEYDVFPGRMRSSSWSFAGQQGSGVRK